MIKIFYKIGPIGSYIFIEQIVTIHHRYPVHILFTYFKY